MRAVGVSAGGLTFYILNIIFLNRGVGGAYNLP